MPLFRSKSVESGDTFEFESIGSNFSTLEAKVVRTAASSVGTTPEALFLAASAAFFARQRNKKRVGLWMRLANRSRPEFQRTVGALANTHLIGVDLSGNPSGQDILRRADASLLGARAHQEMPLAILWRALRGHPWHSGVRVLFDYRAQKGTPSGFEGACTTLGFALPISYPRWFALGIFVTDGEKLSLDVRHKKGAFPCDAIQRIVEEIRMIALFIATMPQALLPLPLPPPSTHLETGSTGEALDAFQVMGKYSISFQDLTRLPVQLMY